MPKERLATAPGGGWLEDFSAGSVKAIGALDVLATAGLILPTVLDIAPILVSPGEARATLHGRFLVALAASFRAIPYQGRASRLSGRRTPRAAHQGSIRQGRRYGAGVPATGLAGSGNAPTWIRTPRRSSTW